MTAARLEADDVRDALRADDVIRHFQLNARKSGDAYRLGECPACHAKSSSLAIVINPKKRSWGHYGAGRTENGQCFGDMLGLVAACAGLNVRRDFPRVLELAAEIAGVTPATTTDADRAQRARQREQQRLADAEQERQRRERAKVTARQAWDRLARRHPAGEGFLAGRGLDAESLVARDVVRFQPNGDPAVGLFDFTGDIINVSTRHISVADGAAKVTVLAGCPTDGTLVGRVTKLGPIAVLVEGVTDSLAAVLAFSGCAVLGAHSAGRLAAVAAAAAPRLVAACGWLAIVPDVDGGVGEDCAADAVLAAERAGLELGKSIHLVDVRPHEDLSDAYRAGWRWKWLT